MTDRYIKYYQEGGENNTVQREDDGSDDSVDLDQHDRQREDDSQNRNQFGRRISQMPLRMETFVQSENRTIFNNSLVSDDFNPLQKSQQSVMQLQRTEKAQEMDKIKVEVDELAKVAKQEGFEVQKDQIEKIFQKIKEIGKKFKSFSPKEEVQTEKESVCLTPHNNLLYYYDDDSYSEQGAVIDCFCLYAKKTIGRVFINDLRNQNRIKVTKLIYSQNRNSYIVGYQDGVVQELNIYNLKLKQEDNSPNQWDPPTHYMDFQTNSYDVNALIEVGKVNDIYGDKKILVVAHQQGYLVIRDLNNSQNDPIVVALKDPVKSFKVAKSKIIAYVESTEGENIENNLEILKVYDMSYDKKKLQIREVCEEILDTNENSKYPEVASKLYQVMNDGTQLILRDKERKGLKIISLEDGQSIATIHDMHERSIMNFAILSNNHTVITCGKDKSVQFWNIISQTREFIQRDAHDQIITCLKVSKDEQYLFTGGLDGKVVVWYLPTRVPLCKLEVTNESNERRLFHQQQSQQDYQDNLLAQFSESINFTMEQSDYGNTKEFEIDELIVSPDNTLLIALNNNRRLNFWEIQTNQQQLSLNLKSIQDKKLFHKQCYITEDEQFMLLLRSDNVAQLWNLDRHIQEEFWDVNQQNPELNFLADVVAVAGSGLQQIFVGQGSDLTIFARKQNIENSKRTQRFTEIQKIQSNDFNQQLNKIKHIQARNKLLFVAYENKVTVFQQKGDYEGSHRSLQEIKYDNINRLLDEKIQGSDIECTYLALSNKGDKLMVTTKNSMFIWEQKEKKFQNRFEKKFDDKDFTPNTFQWLDNNFQKIKLEDQKSQLEVDKQQIDFMDMFVLIGGMSEKRNNSIYMYDVVKKELRQLEIDNYDESMNQNIKWIAWMDNGMKALTSDSKLTIFWDIINKENEKAPIEQRKNIPWMLSYQQNYESDEQESQKISRVQDIKLQKIFAIQQLFYPLITDNNKLIAALHEGYVKKWGNDLVLQFTDDYQPQYQEPGQNYFKRRQDESGFNFEGPLNLLFPKMLQYAFGGTFKEDEVVKFVEPFQFYRILPFELNMIHYYSFQNHSLCLNRVRTQTEMSKYYKIDLFKNTPLEYALMRNSYQSIDELLSFSIKGDTKFYSEMRPSTLIGLIEDNPKNLIMFFDNCVLTVENGKYEKFGVLKQKQFWQTLVKFFKSPCVESKKRCGRLCQKLKYWFNCGKIDYNFMSVVRADKKVFQINSAKTLKKEVIDRMLDDQQNENHKKPIILKRLRWNYNFECGSEDCLDLLTKLHESDHTSIFASEAIENLINFKWAFIKKIIWMQALQYWTFLIIVQLHFYSPETQGFLIGILIFAVLMSFQILVVTGLNITRCCKKKSISEGISFDIWQWVDVLLTFASLYYVIKFMSCEQGWYVLGMYMHDNNICVDEPNGQGFRIAQRYTDEGEKLYKLLYQGSLTGLNLAIWMRSISFLRIFDTIRIFIFMLAKVIKDLQGFIIVFVSFIFAFGTCFSIIQFDKNREGSFLTDLSNDIQLQWLVTLGEFDNTDFKESTVSGKVIFYLSTILMTLILLNLIIAIMTDTFEKVMTTIKAEDKRALCTLITQYENLLFWRRNTGVDRKQYLYWMSYTDQDESNDNWISQVDYITQSIAKPILQVQDSLNVLQEDIQGNNQKLTLVNRQIENKFIESKGIADMNRKELIEKIDTHIEESKDIEIKIDDLGRKINQRFDELQNNQVQTIVDQISQRLKR